MLPTQIPGVRPNLQTAVDPGGSHGLDKIANFASAAIQVSSIQNAGDQKQKDAQTKAAFQNELFKLDQASKQDPSKAEANKVKARVLLNQTVQSNPLLQKDLNSLFSGVSGLPIAGEGFQSTSVQEQAKIAQQKSVLNKVVELGGNTENPNDQQVALNQIQKEARAADLTTQVSIAQDSGTLTNIQADKEASSITVNNVLASQVRTTNLFKQVESLGNKPEEIAKASQLATQTLDLAASQLLARKGNMSQASYDANLKLINDERVRVQKVLTKELKIDVYNKQNQLISAQAKFTINPTPQQAAFNIAYEKLGAIRSQELISILTSNTGFIKAANNKSFIRLLMSDDKNMGNVTTIEGINVPEVNKALGQNLSDTIKVKFSNLRDDDQDVVAKIVGNTAAMWDLTPELVSTDNIKSINNILTSPEYAKSMRRNPKFVVFNSRIGKVLDRTQSRLLTILNKKLPTLNGEVQVSFDAKTGQFNAKPALSNPSDPAIFEAEQLQQNEVALLNSTINSRAALLDIPPEQAGKDLADRLGIGPSQPPTSAISASEEATLIKQFKASGFTEKEIQEALAVAKKAGVERQSRDIGASAAFGGFGSDPNKLIIRK